MKEIKIPHKKIRDPHTITEVTENAFKENDLDCHRHEVERLEDDHKAGVRVLQVKNTQYFCMNHKNYDQINWNHKKKAVPSDRKAKKPSPV